MPDHFDVYDSDHKIGEAFRHGSRYDVYNNTEKVGEVHTPVSSGEVIGWAILIFGVFIVIGFVLKYVLLLLYWILRPIFGPIFRGIGRLYKAQPIVASLCTIAFVALLIVGIWSYVGISVGGVTSELKVPIGKTPEGLTVSIYGMQWHRKGDQNWVNIDLVIRNETSQPIDFACTSVNKDYLLVQGNDPLTVTADRYRGQNVQPACGVPSQVVAPGRTVDGQGLLLIVNEFGGYTSDGEYTDAAFRDAYLPEPFEAKDLDGRTFRLFWQGYESKDLQLPSRGPVSGIRSMWKNLKQGAASFGKGTVRPSVVSAPTFVVNSIPVGCNQSPDTTAEAAVVLEPGTVQAMDAFIHRPDGTWYREVDKGCWIRTDPGPVRMFGTLQKAEGFAAQVRG